ncbi:MAG: hypothetical protein HQL53_13870 [Magnetococcales bacterium]|nr:hypothetical protein [Magnetococcales bacterium]
MKGLKRFLENPWFKVVMGIVLAVSSGIEVWGDIQDEVTAIGAHHGIFIYGLFQILSPLPDMFDGVEELNDTLMEHKSK